MVLSDAEHEALLRTARSLRASIINIVFDSGSGHVGAALSQLDLLVALYWRYLRINPAQPHGPERDRFVLSKGHGGLGLAAVLAERGFFPREDLAHFGHTGQALGMHMDHHRVPGVEVSTGSLGHGLGIAAGLALGNRLQQLPCRTYCLLSDGECYEGSTWEAAQSAANWQLNHLIALVDRNGLTMDGHTEQEAPLEPLADKWAAFGWHVQRCDGHDYPALCAAFDAAISHTGQPSVIIADTVKGKGVDFMEDQARWHYGALDSVMHEAALASIARQPVILQSSVQRPT
jgi:transketolase